MPFEPDIYIVEPIGSGYLAVMAKPKTGEWMDEEFSGIAKSGISRVVSLLETGEAEMYGIEREKEFANATELNSSRTQFVIEVFRIPSKAFRDSPTCSTPPPATV